MERAPWPWLVGEFRVLCDQKKGPAITVNQTTTFHRSNHDLPCNFVPASTTADRRTTHNRDTRVGHTLVKPAWQQAIAA